MHPRTLASTSPSPRCRACSTTPSMRRRILSSRQAASSSATRSSSGTSLCVTATAMNADSTLQALREELRAELTERILPFWMNDALDRRHGGVVGFISEDGQQEPEAPKGCILHARVLWTFSAAYRALGDD